MKNPKSLEIGENRKLVMIVDDEPDMLSMLRLVIEKKCNCDVISAHPGLQPWSSYSRAGLKSF